MRLQAVYSCVRVDEAPGVWLPERVGEELCLRLSGKLTGGATGVYSTQPILGWRSVPGFR